MNTEEKTEILQLLDFERQNIVFPGVTRLVEKGIVRHLWMEEGSCEIAYSSHSASEIDQVINDQILVARSGGYELEWKLYGHDRPESLGERLTVAGFTAGDREAFMVLRASEESLDRFGGGNADIRRITNREGLEDVQRIFEDIYGERDEKRMAEYEFLLEHHPDNMSLYVAYVEGEPASCGRVYFHKDSKFAGLYGGQTREKFRKRGLFTQVVAARIREALNRGIVNISVDALPTSEPILSKRGFEIVTYTQPFSFSV